MLDKSVCSNEEVFFSAFSKLNAKQIKQLLNSFQPDEYLTSKLFNNKKWEMRTRERGKRGKREESVNVNVNVNEDMFVDDTNAGMGIRLAPDSVPMSARMTVEKAVANVTRDLLNDTNLLVISHSS
jgi:hypothetical protein